jgi:hypothetical protein
MVGEKKMSASLTIRENYWESFKIEETDLDFLYNHLLEIETPQTIQELSKELINNRIKSEIELLQKQQQGMGTIYLPKGQFQVNQKLRFPMLNWQEGLVTSVRKGINPQIPSFDVIDVEFEDKSHRQYAAHLETHKLNQPLTINLTDPGLNEDQVYSRFGSLIEKEVSKALEANPDLIQIARLWFPRALLIDINIGHLNLAEAILDMAGGGPLPVQDLLSQMDIAQDVNPKLIEFSLNHALAEDGRFDEVGPTGEVIWYLRRLEPEHVQKPPVFLNFHPIEYNQTAIAPALRMIGSQIIDELEPDQLNKSIASDEITIPLIFPHLRAGTLPLVGAIQSILPTAIQSPRVLFNFVDGETNNKFIGWVVRPSRYVYGLREWYQDQKLIPGSIIKIKRGNNPGEIIVKVEKKRASREWIRTLIVGSDGGIVFAMLKQVIPSSIDERMAIAVPDPDALDQIWSQSTYNRMQLEKVIQLMVRELAKLSPQSHVHAQELYSAVNLVKRCPPGILLHILFANDWATHAGDLYFRLNEDFEE